MSTDTLTCIRGGHVIDPVSGESRVRDVWIANGRIAAAPKAPSCAGGPGNTADKDTPLCALAIPPVLIDASGCYVLPGLTDFHLHMFHGGTEIGLQPDSLLFPQGVTTAVDQGSSGVANCEAFYTGVLAATTVRAYAYLHLCPAGLATTRYLENIDPKNFDPVAIRDVFQRHGTVFRGLKIRQSAEIAGEFGLKPLEKAIRIADDLGLPVVVHTTNPAEGVEKLAAMLRPGDVFSHVYHGRGETIVDSRGEIRPAIRQARERGVLFDTADGRVHFRLGVIRRALDRGFAPDTISTDLTRLNMLSPPVFGLPFIMSKYLALGMRLEDITRAVTLAPTRALGLDPAASGTLSIGARADVAVFRLQETPRTLADETGDSLVMPQLLVPQLTLRDGRAVYQNIEF